MVVIPPVTSRLRCADCYGRMYESPEIHAIVCPARRPLPTKRRSRRTNPSLPPLERQPRGPYREAPPHGTRARYVSRSFRCNCAECSEANKVYQTDYRIRNAATNKAYQADYRARNRRP